MTKIFIIGVDAEAPNGGLTVMYRMADVLNKNGFQAWVVHEKRRYRYPYADHSGTPTITRTSLNPGPEDLVVAPEWSLGSLLRDLRSNWNIVGLFQMALFDTKTLYDLEFSENRLVENPHYAGSLAVSSYLHRLVSRLVPGKPVYNTGMGIDTDRFRRRHRKRKQIALNVYKGVEDLRYLLMLLRSSKKSGIWRSAPIFEIPPGIVTDLLSQSAIYVSTSAAEGLGMLALEAMASEALVVGYDGVGGSEFFTQGLCLKARPHDILDLLDKVEYARNLFENNPEKYTQITTRARKMVEKKYGMEVWEKKVVEAFQKTAEQVRLRGRKRFRRVAHG